ncbi:MAG: transposase [Acidobacteria bacterium]|nr:MAG: transposase [Acidobacteriota bacterium]
MRALPAQWKLKSRTSREGTDRATLVGNFGVSHASRLGARVRYGYYRIYILLRCEGWKVNHKRVCHLYRKVGLSLRRKRPRRHASSAEWVGRIEARAANEFESTDFASDAVHDGRRLRT